MEEGATTPRYPSRAAFSIPLSVDPEDNSENSFETAVSMPADIEVSAGVLRVGDAPARVLEHSKVTAFADLGFQSGGHVAHSLQLPSIAESPLAAQDVIVPSERKWSQACHSPKRLSHNEEERRQDTEDDPPAQSQVQFCEDLPNRMPDTQSQGSALSFEELSSKFGRIANGFLGRTKSSDSDRSAKPSRFPMGKLHSMSFKGWRNKETSATTRRLFAFKKNLQTNYGFGHQTMQRITNFHIKASDVTVGEKIGEGCIGEVFLGTLESTPAKAVAIKKLREDLGPDCEELEGLTAELRVLSKSLKHPSIVEFVGLCIKDNNLLIVMELMEGGSLEDHLAQQEEAEGDSMQTILGWSVDLMEGLAYLHEKEPPLIHRDLKPGNLMLSADRKRVKIADFGLTKSMECLHKAKKKNKEGEEDASEADTEEHSSPLFVQEAAKRIAEQQHIVGTPRYLAPEVWGGTGTTTEKVDIYAAALVIWAMVAGTRPWPNLAGDVAATMAKTCDRPPMRPSRFPPALSQVLDKGWAMAPNSRPTARSMLEELEEIKGE